MAEEEEKQYKAKIAVLGNSGVGKSCLISVFSVIENKRTESYAEIVESSNTTVGCDFMSAKFNLPGPGKRVVKLNIWDTAGQEKYRAINRNLYLGANGALLCFDLTSKFTTDDIEIWRKEVQEHAGLKCCIVVVGTKCDAEVLDETKELLQGYAKENGFSFVETSALTGTNVREVFKIMVTEIDNKIFKHMKQEKDEDRPIELNEFSDAVSSKKSCC